MLSSPGMFVSEVVAAASTQLPISTGLNCSYNFQPLKGRETETLINSRGLLVIMQAFVLSSAGILLSAGMFVSEVLVYRRGCQPVRSCRFLLVETVSTSLDL